MELLSLNYVLKSLLQSWIIGIVEKGNRTARIIDKPRVIEVPAKEKEGELWWAPQREDGWALWHGEEGPAREEEKSKCHQYASIHILSFTLYLC